LSTQDGNPNHHSGDLPLTTTTEAVTTTITITITTTTTTTTNNNNNNTFLDQLSKVGSAPAISNCNTCVKKHEMNTRPLNCMGSLQQRTYHSLHAEDVAVVTLAGVVLGDVCEVSEVIGVLTCAVDVPYLVLTYQFLGTTTAGLSSDRNIWLWPLLSIEGCTGDFGWVRDTERASCFICF
jgi:hypothetical protein